jgi:hypothetical protein
MVFDLLMRRSNLQGANGGLGQIDAWNNYDQSVGGFLYQYVQPGSSGEQAWSHPTTPGLPSATSGMSSFGLPLGPLMQLSSNGVLSVVQLAKGSGAGANTPTSQAAATPTSTLVSTAGSNLKFNLIWDSSAATNTALQQAVIAAAKDYEADLTTKNPITINIQVGAGEVAGNVMASGAAGQSVSYGYTTNYSTLKLFYGFSGPTYSLPSSDPSGGGTFFYTSAEGKALGMVSGSATAVDGAIGINTALPLDYSTDASLKVSGSTSPTATGATTYDAVGIAAHEISEVMGRLQSLGKEFGNNIFTLYDTFSYSAPNTHAININTTPNASRYFSVNNGTTNSGAFNNPANGGDAGDWLASSGSFDSYAASASAGHTEPLSGNDIMADAALGYKMTSAGLALSKTATAFA